MPEEKIDEKIANDYKLFVLNNLAKNNPLIPTVQVLNRYCKQNHELRTDVIKVIVNNTQFAVIMLRLSCFRKLRNE